MRLCTTTACFENQTTIAVCITSQDHDVKLAAPTQTPLTMASKCQKTSVMTTWYIPRYRIISRPQDAVTSCPRSRSQILSLSLRRDHLPEKIYDDAEPSDWTTESTRRCFSMWRSKWSFLGKPLVAYWQLEIVQKYFGAGGLCIAKCRVKSFGNQNRPSHCWQTYGLLP